LELFTQAVAAIDGSKFKAVNTRDKNFTKAKLKSRMDQVRPALSVTWAGLVRFRTLFARAANALGQGFLLRYGAHPPLRGLEPHVPSLANVIDQFAHFATCNPVTPHDESHDRFLEHLIERWLGTCSRVLRPHDGVRPIDCYDAVVAGTAERNGEPATRVRQQQNGNTL
jgi:hypothetical protein